MGDINELEGQAEGPDKRFCLQKTLQNLKDYNDHRRAISSAGKWPH